MPRHRRLGPFVALGALLILVAAARAYTGADDHWIRGQLPAPLLRRGPFGVLWWQWLALPALALLAFVLGRLLGRASRAALRVVFERTVTPWDDRLLLEVAPALNLFWSVLVAEVLVSALALPSMHGTGRPFLASALILAFAWALWRSVFVAWQMLLTRPSVAQRPSARPLIGIGALLARTLVVVIAIFAIAAAFGYRLTPALAGLGIGGIAVALGAQKMIENLFGSLSIVVDQPFHVDDLVTVDGVTGTVERLGFRSTRIRTADRTLITLPNGKLADMRIETLAARDRRRLATTLSLAHSTTRAQTTQVIEGVKRVLTSHPRVWPDRIMVSLADVGPYALDIEIMVWFQTADEMEFRLLREEVLLAFIRVVEEAGTIVAWYPRTEQLATGNQRT
jgi:MscS family membrane protein